MPTESVGLPKGLANLRQAANMTQLCRSCTNYHIRSIPCCALAYTIVCCNAEPCCSRFGLLYQAPVGGDPERERVDKLGWLRDPFKHLPLSYELEQGKASASFKVTFKGSLYFKYLEEGGWPAAVVQGWQCSATNTLKRRRLGLTGFCWEVTCLLPSAYELKPEPTPATAAAAPPPPPPPPSNPPSPPRRAAVSTATRFPLPPGTCCCALPHCCLLLKVARQTTRKTGWLWYFQLDWA